MSTTTLEHVMNITTRPPVVMTEGSGSWLQDSEGRRYLDFVQGWAVNCLGHAHPVMRRALDEQAARLINCSPSFYNAPMARLATLVAGSSGLRDVFFCNSGAEANEGAIKLARRWGQKHRGGAYEIVTTHGAFHGRTLATMSASGKAAFEPLFEPKVPGFVKVELNASTRWRRPSPIAPSPSCWSRSRARPAWWRPPTTSCAACAASHASAACS